MPAPKLEVSLSGARAREASSSSKQSAGNRSCSIIADDDADDADPDASPDEHSKFGRVLPPRFVGEAASVAAHTRACVPLNGMHADSVQLGRAGRCNRRFCILRKEIDFCDVDLPLAGHDGFGPDDGAHARSLTA